MNAEKIRSYHLHKQNLFDQAPCRDYRFILQRHIALHSTDYLTPYLSLWARVDGFDPQVLFRDINEHRSALRLRAFRGTVFVLDREVLSEIIAAKPLFYSASRIGEVEKLSKKVGFDLQAFEARMKRLLSGGRSLTTAEIKKELGSGKKIVNEFFSFAIRYLEFIGILCRGGQRHIADKSVRYALLEEWFPETKEPVSSEDAFDSLVIKYIGLFGPVTAEDLCWWFPVTKTMALDSLNRLGDKIIHVKEDGPEYLMEAEDYRIYENHNPARDRGDVVCFLPYEDHFPKAYAGRKWFLSDPVTSLVTRTGTIFRGQIFPSIWLNGEIVGGWELVWKDGNKSAAEIRITGLVSPVEAGKDIMNLIDGKRKDLERFVNEGIIPLMRC